MAKPKYRLWVTVLPKRASRYDKEYPQQYDLHGYVIAACEDHAKQMLTLRGLGERLRLPDEATPCPYRNRLVRQTPKTLSRFLSIRIERGSPWISTGMGSYLGEFARLAVASNLITAPQLAELVHSLCSYGCRGMQLVEWIQLMEVSIPGHTLSYAEDYYRAHPF